MSVHVEYHLVKSVAEKETCKAGNWINRDAQPGVNAADTRGLADEPAGGQGFGENSDPRAMPARGRPERPSSLGDGDATGAMAARGDPGGWAKTALVAY